MLRIKLFGTGQADYLDRSLEGFPTQQPHLLLCYLLLNSSHPHLRDQLATVFWGEYPTQVSRKYLRNGLWKLRQIFEVVGVSLDEYLLVNDESVAFIQTSPYWLDVEAFETAVQSCRDISGQDLNAEQAGELSHAVDLYSGDLLEGIYCDWCLYERERLSLLYLSTLSKLMSYNERCGHYEQGLAYGGRILGRDNTRERVHLQMMRLYWASGDRNAALAQYKRCTQILRDELGIAPTKETTAIYQQMVHNQYLPAHREPSPPAHVPVGKVTGTPTRQRQVENETEAGFQALAEKALFRLHYLQEMLEETNAELRYIELLIQKELLYQNSTKVVENIE